MGRSFVFWLVMTPVCVGAYWIVLHGRFVPPLDLAVPAIAGMMMATAAGNLRDAFRLAATALRLRRATERGIPGERPRDGEVLAVTGRIRTSGTELRAPFSDRPAVLYAYEIRRGSFQHYAGCALRSAVIDGGRGPVRLLGFPQLEGFDGRQPARALEHARQYVAGTKFVERHDLTARAVAREISSLPVVDGAVRADWRRRAGGELSDSMAVLEDVVLPGDEVTAIGRYSAGQYGLVADRAHPLRLVRGDGRRSAARLWQKAASLAVAALLFAAMLNGVLFGFLAVWGDRPIGIPNRATRSSHRPVDVLVHHRVPQQAGRDETLGQDEVVIAAPVDLRA